MLVAVDWCCCGSCYGSRACALMERKAQGVCRGDFMEAFMHSLITSCDLASYSGSMIQRKSTKTQVIELY